MRMVGPVTVCAAIAALAVGCSPIVAGTAKPAKNLKPRPLFGSVLRQVPLDDTALTRMLEQPFLNRQPPVFGGPDKLGDADSAGSSPECLGVTTMLQRNAYESADVRDVMWETWWNDGDPAQVISVIEGVVSLPSAAQAQTLFAQFPQQWQQCKDATTTEQTGPIKTTTVVNSVRVADSVVAATNTATAELPNIEALQATPQARAVGVRLNCIVEVEVVFFGDRHPSDPGSANPDTSAVDIAHAMMKRIDTLS
ncbi:sensor domain-containing protein [Mycobacterium cookii]|uniref:Sensor domain-containing protein n=1 Tax=Mycobacterium cookii TaxID=1775 RepID=A0A7I7KVF2_9MYCO|nr:sensor domain-containing protein [Mycobacterium cookii]MCV7332525.1 sensor domain-containing protein [Mycobacterium cookii]BBX45438.1 sensor domain-containing protein [Mycobacterium cookii]